MSIHARRLNYYINPFATAYQAGIITPINFHHFR
jgi:hypothetical protein